jgi:hypothetical protein
MLYGSQQRANNTAKSRRIHATLFLSRTIRNLCNIERQFEYAGRPELDPRTEQTFVCIKHHHHHHQPINVPTAGAQAFIIAHT